MLVSYNWLKDLVDFDYSPKELDRILTMLGVEVEGIINYGEKYQNFLTAEVISKEKHPDADKLSVCKVSTGDEEFTVVCGAPNVAMGQKIVFAKLGAVVPESGFKLKKAKIRGISSSGMICSEFELEMGDDKSGIMVLPDQTELGQKLIDFAGLNDIILDVSLTPNRPDCLSHIGVAREIAAKTGNPLKKPRVVINGNDYTFPKADFTPGQCDGSLDGVKVIIEDKEKCPRYAARIVRNAKIQESPEWLKKRLISVGIRPVSVPVDVCNYVLMEAGQPLHAFDLDKLSGGEIHVKTAANKEKFITLDGKQRTLNDDMLMINDKEKSIAVGGVMGGENSEISQETKNILIESAYFDASSIRKTSKILGIQSEASYRFERGVDVDNVLYALNRSAQLIAELTGGEVVDGLIDVYPNPIEKKVISLRFSQARKVIGHHISNDQMLEMLTSIECRVIEKDDEKLTIEAPLYRVDLFEEVDLIEEVARIYNFDEIPAKYESMVSINTDTILDELSIPPLRDHLRHYLVKNGFTETLTQNMTDPESAGFFSEDFVELSNALGEELSIMRTSVIPSVLRTILRNIRSGRKDLMVYEIGKSFHKVDEKEKTFISGIKENENLVIAQTGKTGPMNWSIPERDFDFYDIKGLTEDLISHTRFGKLKLSQNIKKLLKTSGFISTQQIKAFSSNTVAIKFKKEIIGFVGELSQVILKKHELEQSVFVAWFNLSRLYEIQQDKAYFSPVSPYPSISRDLGFVVDKSMPAEKIQNLIETRGGKLLKNVNIFDVFQGEKIGEDKKNIAFSLSYSAPDRTLTDTEVDDSIKKIIEAAEKELDCQLRKF